nr:reverse transcriptase N-terminal domain-containing protein [Phormidesmis priestleyi]
MNGKRSTGAKLEVKVFKLQKRIYQASLRGDGRLVHKLNPEMDGGLPARNIRTLTV